jgi:hypothetical protein
MRSSQRAARAMNLDDADALSKTDPTMFSRGLRATLAQMRLRVAMEESGPCAELWLAVIVGVISDLTKPDKDGYNSAVAFFEQPIIPQAEAIGLNSSYLKQTLITLRLL